MIIFQSPPKYVCFDQNQSQNIMLERDLQTPRMLKGQCWVTDSIVAKVCRVLSRNLARRPMQPRFVPLCSDFVEVQAPTKAHTSTSAATSCQENLSPSIQLHMDTPRYGFFEIAGATQTNNVPQSWPIAPNIKIGRKSNGQVRQRYFPSHETGTSWQGADTAIDQMMALLTASSCKALI